MSEKICFFWDYDAPLDDVHFRLYEDGVMVVDNIKTLSIELSMVDKEFKQYEYSLATVRTLFNLESPRTQPVIVNFTQPMIPKNFRLVAC